MSQKYTDARYPEKINDLIDNEGNVNPEIIPPAPTPEPGLKLYKHTFVYNGYTLSFICEIATPISNFNSYPSRFFPLTPIVFAGDSCYYKVGSGIPGSKGSVYGITGTPKELYPDVTRVV